VITNLVMICSDIATTTKNCQCKFTLSSLVDRGLVLDDDDDVFHRLTEDDDLPLLNNKKRR
jgi:hypothetical protein